MAVGGTYCLESFIIHLHVLHGQLRLFASVFLVFTTRWAVRFAVMQFPHEYVLIIVLVYTFLNMMRRLCDGGLFYYEWHEFSVDL